MADVLDKWPPPLMGRNLVTRKEYDELFLAITRLTDRIEVLEAKLRLYEPVKLRDIEFDSMVPVQVERDGR